MPSFFIGTIKSFNLKKIYILFFNIEPTALASKKEENKNKFITKVSYYFLYRLSVQDVIDRINGLKTSRVSKKKFNKHFFYILVS